MRREEELELVSLVEVPKVHVRQDLRALGALTASKLGWIAGQLEVTSHCYQKCRMCDSWRADVSGRQTGTWLLSEVLDLFDGLSSSETFRHLTLTGGDPQSWCDLDTLLQKHDEHGFRFALQLNTALTQDVIDPALWRRGLSDLRVSLDSLDEHNYQLQRGDKRTTPAQVIERLRKLRHPRLQVAVCVTSLNVHEIPHFVQLFEAENIPIRKLAFIPVIGEEELGTVANRGEGFWASYVGYAQMYKDHEATSFAESVPAVRASLVQGTYDDVACHAGSSTFHLKANGDWYPCCLVGGEAIVTHPEMRVVNWQDQRTFQPNAFATLEFIRKIYQPSCHYGDPSKPCSNICQYKQLSLNIAAHEAIKTVIAMP